MTLYDLIWVLIDVYIGCLIIHCIVETSLLVSSKDETKVIDDLVSSKDEKISQLTKVIDDLVSSKDRLTRLFIDDNWKDEKISHDKIFKLDKKIKNLIRSIASNSNHMTSLLNSTYLNDELILVEMMKVSTTFWKYHKQLSTEVRIMMIRKHSHFSYQILLDDREPSSPGKYNKNYSALLQTEAIKAFCRKNSKYSEGDFMDDLTDQLILGPEALKLTIKLFDRYHQGIISRQDIELHVLHYKEHIICREAITTHPEVKVMLEDYFMFGFVGQNNEWFDIEEKEKDMINIDIKKIQACYRKRLLRKKIEKANTYMRSKEFVEWYYSPHQRGGIRAKQAIAQIF